MKTSKSKPTMMAQDSDIIELDSPPGTSVKYPSPKYWESPEGKEYFILAAGGDDKFGVLAYSFENDEWFQWCDYPDDVNPEESISVIDHENGFLYVTHGIYPLLARMNLVTKEWKVIVTKNDDTYSPYRDRKNVQGRGGRSRILPSRNGAFHVLATRRARIQHLKYNDQEEEFVKVSQRAIEDNCNLKDGALVYVKHKNYLMQLGGILNNKPTEKCWYTNLNKTEQGIKRKIMRGNEESDEEDDDEQKEIVEEWNAENYVWKQHSLKMPFPARTVRVAYAFDRKVIFAFVKKEKKGKGETFILDTDEDEENWKWVPSTLPKDKHPEKADVIVTNTNEIHFIYAWRKKRIHFKMHLSKFMPSEMWEKHVSTQQPQQEEKQPGVKEDCAKCDQYEKKLQSLQQRKKKLTRNKVTINLERRAIETRVMTLNERWEELKDELDAAKQEVAKLRRKNIDVTKYMEWSAEEFVDYICTVEDGRFLKYEEQLRKAFGEEEVDGQAIPHMEKGEWREFGVKNYMDRTRLHKCIKDLVNGKVSEGGTQFL